MIALRMLLRDWRGGELGVLLAALVVAVAIVSGISAFTTRLQSSLEQESHRFLAADRVIYNTARPLPDVWEAEAVNRNLATARLITFASMVYAGDEGMHLASVKAASEGYPLRGELMMSEQAFGEPAVTEGGPPPGQVWLDSRLFPLLNVETGDEIFIGDAALEVAGALRSEPDRATGMVAYGPRVLMHIDDIPATNVVQPGSRVGYRLLLAGEEAELDEYMAWLKPQITTQRVLDVGNSQRGVGSALGRAESFLLLAGSLGVVLAGVAIALAARRFSERHYDYVAIMKSLGAESGRINRLYGVSLLLLGLTATALGAGLGWALQALFFELFAEALPVQPGPSGPRPYLIGAATALICLLSFAWPPLSRLGGASPLKVLRRDLPNVVSRSVLDNAIGLGAVMLLMLWYSGDVALTLAVLAGLAASASLAAGIALLMLRGGRLAGMRAGSIWRLALASLQRNGGANTLQVVIFSLAIMLLLILVLVRTSLLEEWQMQLPEGTPNHFLLNIAPDEVNTVRESLHRKAVLSEPLYPMIRGRIVEVNGVPLGRSDDPEEGRRERESNLTWSREVPTDNQLVAGTWWEPDTTEALVSVEEGMAEELQLKVGDRVSYLVGSQPLEATVSSIRRLQWESMRPNFFMVFPPAVLQGYPATFMTSFHLDAGNKTFLNEFIREFPTVTVIEIDVVIDQVRGIIDQVSAAIELVLVVILLAGTLVLIAGVQSSVDTRLHEGAILRALGARRGLILGGVVIEFAALGLFAGLLATVAAEIAVYVLQTFALDMTYSAHPEIWLLGPACAVILIGALGVWNCRRVVSSPPLLVLREL